MCNEYCERWRKHTKTSQWHLFPAHWRSNQINSLVLLVTVNEENKEVNVWNTWWDIVGVLKPHLHWKLVHTRHPHQVQHNCWTWQHFFFWKKLLRRALLIYFLWESNLSVKPKLAICDSPTVRREGEVAKPRSFQEKRWRNLQPSWTSVWKQVSAKSESESNSTEE